MIKETVGSSESTDVVVSGDIDQGDPKENESGQIQVVGIGASAGGLESIEGFFENIDAKTGAAFVVIQHLSPDFKSFMPEILSNKTELEVLTASDQMQIRPNVIYLMPPRMNLVLEGNIIYLTEIKRTSTPNKPINLFFASLATYVKDKAIAVVLSGTGTDGAEGVCRVNEAGGKVYVESVASAKFDGMPAAAISQRVHIGEGTPFEIAGRIFGKKAAEHHSPANFLEKDSVGSDERARIFKSIEERYGVDFSRYKITTVSRRIDRRMTELNINELAAYWEFIQQNPDEVTELYYDMLIGVTKFFRDPEAFELIKQDIKRIVESKNAGDEVRVWSAGCASGEETYSLAMLFSDEINRSKKSLHLKVFATDIDDEILGRATSGLYRKEQMDDVPAGFLSKYFDTDRDRYKVSAALRSRIVFARHNIMNDPPFAKLDMIVCRNLLIYLDNDTQGEVLSLFYLNLNSRGTLFLGPSESLGKYAAGFETTDSKWKIFSKSDDSLSIAKIFQPRKKREREFPVVAEAAQRPASFASTAAMKINYDVAYQALLEHYVPAGLLIDESQNLLHVYGEPPFTLSFKPGKVSNNLRSFLDENLCTAVSVCIQRTKREGISIEYSNFAITEKGQERYIDFKVTPVIPKSADHILYFMITFGEESTEKPGDIDKPAVVGKEGGFEQISLLEEELKNTKLLLQATIEELESTNEERMSTNEELLASNEELQSTNEELHSVNEELYTVNAEYQSKILELNQLSIDEKRLFQSTGVGTIFIDQERRIRKFTPTAAEFFNLLSQDEGRPFNHVTHLFDSANFNQLVEQSIESQNIIEAEVTTRENEPHIIKIVPYKNDRNEPDGVVISFVSIQAAKNAEQLYKDMFHSSPVGIIGLTPDLKIVSLNQSLKHLLGYSDNDLLGQSLTRIFPASQADDASQVVASYINEEHGSDKAEQVPSTVVRQDGQEVHVEISVNSVPTATGTMVHLYVTDMTDRQRFLSAVESHRDDLEDLVAERTAELDVRNTEYEDLYENAPDMYASVSPVTACILKCNNRMSLKTGYEKSELIGMTIFDLYHPDCHVDAKAAFKQFTETGVVNSLPLQLKSKSGKRIPVLLNVDAVLDKDGNVTQSRSTWVDVSDVELLKKDNKTFLLATQASEIGIWDWDFVNGEQSWSTKFHELLGYPESTQERLSFDNATVVHRNDRDGLTALFKNHFLDQTEFNIELRLKTFSGDYRWFRLQGKAVRNDTGKVIRMVGSAQDVHDARQAQNELVSQAEIQSFITQETNDGWWDWDFRTNTQYFSPRFWNILGINPEERMHSPSEWKEILHPDDLKLSIENFTKHSESYGKHPFTQETRYKHVDGHWVTFICRCRVIEWSKNGEPLRLVGVHTDISKLKQQEHELKEINDQLAKSNEDLEQFAYITSHDLKAPLRGISTLVTFMEEDLEGVLDNGSEQAESIRGNLRRLSRQATRMEGLISGVLDYSRIDSVGATFENVGVKELLADIAVDHQLSVGSELFIPDELPGLRTDPIMFEQVFSNLISNAIKFHPDPEELIIEIGFNPGSEFHTFSVADNGPGIKPEFHLRIFDMFQTLHNKDTYESTGIGLTLVKRIVEKFGGKVSIDSDEGQGATFSFTWPVESQDPRI